MDNRALELENLKYLAARAALDGGMDEAKAMRLLSSDLERAKHDSRAKEGLEKVLKKDFQIGYF